MVWQAGLSEFVNLEKEMFAKVIEFLMRVILIYHIKKGTSTFLCKK